MVKCLMVMTLERRSDSTATDVAVKSTASQHVPSPIGECPLSLYCCKLMFSHLMFGLVLLYFVCI